MTAPERPAPQEPTAQEHADTLRGALAQLRGILRVHVLPADDALDGLCADLAAAREALEQERLAEQRGKALRQIQSGEWEQHEHNLWRFVDAALADGGQNTQTTPKLEAGLGADDDGQQETQT